MQSKGSPVGTPHAEQVLEIRGGKTQYRLYPGRDIPSPGKGQAPVLPPVLLLKFILGFT